MKKVGWLLLAVLLGSAHACAAGPAEPRFDIGGGFDVGGFFGEMGDSWSPGAGGLLFAQVPWKHNLEGRLLAGMVWNDASDDGTSVLAAGRPEGTLDHYRRTNLEATALWRVESLSIQEFAVPYLGVGIGTYERRVEYRPVSMDGAVRPTSSGWDAGFHGLAGMRFYRTSGLFLGLEGGARWIDTPGEWTEAYDVSLLLGIQLGI